MDGNKTSNGKRKMKNKIIENIPDLGKYSLYYIFENLKLTHKQHTLWLEFGVYSGKTINYISKFTDGKVYGFDSFEGLPEFWRKGWFGEVGSFSLQGKLPKVNENVELVKGWFNETLEPFLESTPGKVSFLHLDADLYSSTKYVLDTLTKQNRIDKNCIIVFDELLNFPEFDGDTSELKALCEWTEENSNLTWQWIGMNGKIGDSGIDQTENNYEGACLQVTNI